MGKKQVGPSNTASGNDRVVVQAGAVLGKKGADKAAPAAPKTENVRTENIRSGNATVGRQVDVHHGDLRL